VSQHERSVSTNLTVIVDTSCGQVRGAVRDDIYAFRGIPYGANTGGVNRFQPPQPIAWSGVRDALDCGARAPQNEQATKRPYLTWLRDPRPYAEDCLSLNVFTASLEENSSPQPVMVYMHGGGFAISSAGTPGVDGTNLARRGAVVVTVNHRLNVFGHLFLGDAEGGRYADAGNAGMLDLLQALRWVQLNISRFGGDPANVTLFGQSGGGSKVAVLMAMPQAHGLFHKAIIQSSSSLLEMATQEEAERSTHYFLAQLGLDKAKLRTLHELPAETLLRAVPAAIRSAGRIDNHRPVVDGRSLPSQPFDAQAVRLSSNVPLLTGWCDNEQRLTFASTPQLFHQSEQEARLGSAQALGVSEADVRPLMDVYRGTRPGDMPGDIHAQIFGDHRYRRTVTRAAELQATHYGAPAYMYLLDWQTPVLNGLLRTPHTLCIAFAFANVDVAAGMTGTGSDRYLLQEQVAGAWIAFARSGDPNHPLLPAWPSYSIADRSTMIFDRQTKCANDPMREERIAFDPYPRYKPSVGEGRLR
jgi:para-nitrobenzyl esterase